MHAAARRKPGFVITRSTPKLRKLRTALQGGITCALCDAA